MGFLAKATSIQITPDLFAELRQEPNFNEILRDLDVDEEDQFNLFETLDLDGNGFLDLSELFEGITKLRGDARRSDVISIQLMIRGLQLENRDFFRHLYLMLESQEAPLRYASAKGTTSSTAKPALTSVVE